MIGQYETKQKNLPNRQFIKALVELLGFTALVSAGWIVHTALGLGVLGVGLLVAANVPERG